MNSSNTEIITAPSYFKDNLTKSLTAVLNEKVRIELKNNHIVYGTLQKITDFTKMNITLYNVVLKTPNDTTKLKNIAIRGNHIRHMILPDLVDLNELKKLGKPYSITVDSSKKRTHLSYDDNENVVSDAKRRKLK